MSLDGNHLNDSRVKLFLSSRNEMQATIEEARQRHLAYQAGFTAVRPVSNGAPYPMSSAPPSRPYAPEPYPPVPQAFNPYQAPYARQPSPPTGYHPYRPSSRGSDSDRSRDGSRGQYRRPERRRSRSRSRSRSRDRRRRSRSGERHPRDRPARIEDKFAASREDGACVQFRCVGGDMSYRLIRDFFDETHLPNPSMKIVNALDGKRFGLAYIRFNSKADQLKALAKNNGNCISCYSSLVSTLEPARFTARLRWRPSCDRHLTPNLLLTAGKWRFQAE